MVTRSCHAGLGGELRAVPHAEKRVQEALKLGYNTAVVPAVSHVKPTGRLKGMRVLSCRSISDALAALFGDDFEDKGGKQQDGMGGGDGDD